MSKGNISFIDLFAGAGGLSEGFIRTGYDPVAHVEIDEAACFSLRTRMAYHWLKNNNQLDVYYDYLYGRISRSALYNSVPYEIIDSVINKGINQSTLKDIFKQVDKKLSGRKLDLIVGGPPCQAYSLVGRSRDRNNMRKDDRNSLYIYYADFLKKYKPRFFVFENVIGILSAKTEKGELYFDLMRDLFKKVGYETEFKVLRAQDYGIPQQRKRVILIGRRGRKKGFYVEPEKQPNQNLIINEIFEDLPELQAGEGTVAPCKIKSYSGSFLYDAKIKSEDVPVTLHIARPNKKQDLKIYRIAVEKWNKGQMRLNYNDLPKKLKTHKNRTSFTDRFKVVAGDIPFSHTIVAHIAKDGHYYIHHDIKQNRSLTPREVARIQTFPDDYFFESVSEKTGRTAAYKQIGNAVPVLLAQKIAKRLLENF